jgi:hypothetical protein
MKGGSGDGRQPRSGEGVGMAWVTSAAVGQRGAAGTGLEPACMGDGTRSHETGEAGALTSGLWLQFRAAVKFNLKSNLN